MCVHCSGHNIKYISYGMNRGAMRGPNAEGPKVKSCGTGTENREMNPIVLRCVISRIRTCSGFTFNLPVDSLISVVSGL